MKQTLTPYKSAPGRKVFMERLDATTNSHIMEEAPSILPRDATQWDFECVPVVMHGCARLTDGQGGYIHKKKVRCSVVLRFMIHVLFSKASETVPRRRKSGLAHLSFSLLDRT